MKTPSITILLLLCFSVIISGQDMELEADAMHKNVDETIKILAESEENDTTTMMEQQEVNENHGGRSP